MNKRFRLVSPALFLLLCFSTPWFIAEARDLSATRESLLQLRQKLVSEYNDAVTEREQASNRKTLAALRRASRRLERVKRELNALDYAKANDIAYTEVDWMRFHTELEGADADPENTSATHLLPESVLRTTDEYVIWTVDGLTRVQNRGFQPPTRMWAGDDLRPRLARETVLVSEVREAGAEAVRLHAAANEFESFQIVVTSRNGHLEIGETTISDLTGASGRISSDEVSVNVVGMLRGLAADSHTQIGPFPDVLYPEGHHSHVVPNTNHALFFTIYVPCGTQAGDYEGTVTLNVNGESLEPIPVHLHVWNFGLPRETHVATQLFAIDITSICYWYGVAPWEERARELIERYLENMAEHRFSPASTPPLPRIRWEEFPDRTEGRFDQGIHFQPGRKLTLAGPKFEEMTEGVTLSCWLRTETADLGRWFRHQWQGRPSGYWLSLNNGKLVATIGLGMRAPEPEAQLSADYPRDGNWHHVALTYQPGTASLFVDGKQMATKTLDLPMSPSYGGLVHLQAEAAAFDVDEVRWAPMALAPDQVADEMLSPQAKHSTLKAYNFAESTYDFAARRQPGSPEELDRDYLLQWADWCRKRGLWLNHIGVPRNESMEKLNRLYFQPLRERGLLSRAYMRLPHDEASYGPGAEKNRQWSSKLHAVAPELFRHQTLGGMGGTRSTSTERVKALEQYVGLVDIWSMRAHIFERHKDFFQKRVADGDNLSIYIHDANWIDVPTILPAGRNYFWYLFRYDLHMVTLWNVNLWFQPEKNSRPQRRSWETEEGFWTLKRNPSGITCGMLFYPGENGPLNSLRTEAWRDGIEDYEYLVLFRDALTAAKERDGHDNVLHEAEQLMREIKQWKVTSRTWRSRPTTDSSRIQTMRHRVAKMIETLISLN
ncbi:MAG: DUF4091 domain-containing protein [Candidatus Pacebacteria bacterium]|nr:DUF4091 domain-containing protein [Candidatus Paceibacterota bacterium]